MNNCKKSMFPLKKVLIILNNIFYRKILHKSRYFLRISKFKKLLTKIQKNNKIGV
jgi:hypothetical protein